MPQEFDDVAENAQNPMSEAGLGRFQTDDKRFLTESTSRRVIGEQKAMMALITSFLDGKCLYVGESGPYQFVSLSHLGRVGLRRTGHERYSSGKTYEVNLSEVSLLLECGSDRVWVFITIPDRYRSKYTWLSPVGFGYGDLEVCGVLVDTI